MPMRAEPLALGRRVEPFEEFQRPGRIAGGQQGAMECMMPPFERPLIALAIFAGLHLDPVLNMFTWISQIGTLGVLGMMTVTSLSVIVFFRRRQREASALSTLILPALSGLIMAALFVYIFVHFGDLTVTTGGAPGIILPALIPAAAVVGYLLALRLEKADPARFTRMGENLG